MRADDSDNRPAGAASRQAAPAVAGAAAFVFQGDSLCYVNPAAAAMTGYSADELLAMEFWRVIHPEHRDLVRQRGLARQRGESVPWSYEVKIQPKSGEPFWVEFSAGMIEFDRKPAVLGIAVDLTERRAATARAQDNESRQRALIENSSDVVLIVGPDLRVRYVGPSIERILGFAPQEMLDDDNLHRIHPDDHTQVRAGYAAALVAPGCRAQATYRIRHRDGSWHWFESIAVNMMDDPCVAGMIINSRDVTDRVEAQTAYRSLVDHSLQGLLIIQDGRIVFANPRIAQVTGYTVDELIALEPDALRTLVHPDDQDGAWQDAYRVAEETGEPGYCELRIVRRDGAMRWIETSVSRVDFRGRSALQVAHVDVTERKRAQEDARLHQQELAHVLRRRTMGEMAAVFAHEVNQPLSAIMSYAKGCAHRLRTGGGPPEPLLAALDEIGTQAMRAAEIIKRLRRFVRKGELQRQRLQLNDLVDEVVRFIASEARQRSVRLQVELAPDLPTLEVDAVQIEQVILNLMRNALEAMYESPGEQLSLTVRTRRANGAIEVSVSDRGAGLRPDVAADIFEPFVTSKPDGLGMGLSICRTIIDAHGGQVWTTANPDRGVTFHFSLPLPAFAEQRASG